MLSPPNTWRSRRAAGEFSTRRREPVPTIVAEALIDVPDPLTGLLSIGPDAPLEQVRCSLIRSLAPIEADGAIPAWLRPEQVAPFRRALAAIERYRGVLVADPVGSGKTYVALAVAAALGETTVAVVPASLKDQWQRIALQLGVPISLHSHEALSRGRIPDPRARLVVVDESHRFRTPGIRRYRELARYLVGRRVLLLSATPVVNRLVDLGHQLRLGIRDDALGMRGAPSFSQMLERGRVTGALGDVVLCRADPADRPASRAREIEWSTTSCDREALSAIDHLTLSSSRGIAALIRMVLWRALASSRPALAQALGRYQRLLDHAAQASALGRTVTRAEIRTFTEGALDQLVMWEVLPTLSAPADLVLEDRAQLGRLAATLEGAAIDPRVVALGEMLTDGKISLVFTSSRDTLEALRSELDDLKPAWVTGAGAGIGHTRMDREIVLDLFRPTFTNSDRLSPHPLTRPTTLLTTDVAAEGLNLQLAQRVVHFDLPWTSVRIDQREGRAIRLGSTNAEVEVVRFAPWPALDQRLRQVERLITKKKLASQAGLDDEGRWLYRWRAELGEETGDTATAGFAVAEGDRNGWLVGLALDLMFPGGVRRAEPASLIWIEPDGSMIEDPQFVTRRLAEIRGMASPQPGCEDREAAGRVLIGITRARLQAAQQSSWLQRESPFEQRQLVRRMRRVASEAARQRNQRMLELADRALDWLSGGVTAGEAALVAELTELPTGRLAAAWQRLLREPRVRPIPVPRLTGVIRYLRR